ncbi:MAG: hypothetical protein EBT07_16015, partial [Actinobacteria bacterium]|nr:hypothetical protein [Actinomycetota bacterium]
GGLVKTGSKMLTLSGSNSFSGDITISGGTLATLRYSVWGAMRS